jgi:hypothetical protein
MTATGAAARRRDQCAIRQELAVEIPWVANKTRHPSDSRFACNLQLAARFTRNAKAETI